MLQIAVASGKGGTGKTTVATNLALALAGEGPVQFLDCDVEEPNAHLFLHPALGEEEAVTIPVPAVEEGQCTACGRCAEVCAFNAIAVLAGHVLTFPELCHGCGGCTLLCPEGALREEKRKIGIVQGGQRGELVFVQGKLEIGAALAPPVVEAVRAKEQGMGTVIIDAAPGTSCPVVAAIRDVDFCLLVTEPTPFGLHDLDLAARLVAELGVPAVVILNRAGEGDELVEEYCQRQGLPLLLKIPFSRNLAAIYAQGKVLVEELPQWREVFLNLGREIGRRVGR